MKKFIRKFIATLLFLTMLPVNSFAVSETEITENVIYLDNGSYITIELSQLDSRASGSKRGTKTYTYRGSDGVEEWRAVLTGTFTYTGSSASCTAVSCNVTITDTNWYEVSKTTSKSGASALCDLTMGRKILGITIGKETINMKITCDANGNLS